MLSLLFYVLMIGAWLGVGLAGVYGLLILGRLLNHALIQKHHNRWMVYMAGILGLSSLIAGYFLRGVYSEWLTALGALLSVLVAVIVINFKGCFTAAKSS